MNLEQRVAVLEIRNRRMRRVLIGFAVLAVLGASLGAHQLTEDLWLVGSLEIKDPATRVTKTVLRSNGDAVIGGNLQVQGRITTGGIGFSPTADGQNPLTSVAAALPQARIHSVSGGDPAEDLVRTASEELVDVPDMAIPFRRDRDTNVLVFFSSGEMDVPFGAAVHFHLGYETPLPPSSRLEFHTLRTYALDTDYQEFGNDFVWMGPIPAGKNTIRVKWRSPTRRPTVMGVRGGAPRRLVVVELP